MSEKSAVRAELLSRRSALDEAARAEASTQVIAHLLAHIPPARPAGVTPPLTAAAQPANPAPSFSGAGQPASPGRSTEAGRPASPTPPSEPSSPAPSAVPPPTEQARSASPTLPPSEPGRSAEPALPQTGTDRPEGPAGPAGAGRPVVAAYVPIGAEPGGPGLPDALRNAGARVLLPVLRPDNDLDWAEYEGGLDRARRGLLEPPEPRVGVDAIAGADLVVVPALAVDRRGARLGRGGGSYDRALARVPAGTPVVALLHDGELVDEVPVESHDRLVSAVITPSGGWCDLPYIR